MALNQALPSHSSGVVAVNPTSGKKPQRSLPRELTDLLKAVDAVASKRMWSRFIAAHNRLIMAVAKSLGHGYDDVMDRYTYALDELKRDDFRRLRAYEAESAAKFEIWLVAVMRRLCVDYHRKKYGRSRPKDDASALASAAEAARKHLADFIMRDIDLTSARAPSTNNPETSLRRKELGQLLEQELARLSDTDQLLLKLRFQDDVPVREITTIMRFPNVFNVYRRLKTILKELEGGLRRHGVEDVEP